MKIFFSKEQFKYLVRSIAIANWVIAIGEDNKVYDGLENEFVEDNDKYSELQDYILTFAKDMGMKDYIKKEGDEIFLNEDTMMDLAEIMDEFDEGNFYYKLIKKLVTRDCVEKYGEEYFDMTPDDAMECEKQFLDKYIDEFQKNDIENIRISK